ncbi:maleylpyruvate isomerase N-terminal domain-containing protein [Ilumatobacter sp.]|uniref:maleylpyruvate isomerase N-terminal domain-containing protein n=1 Tax=Ilumatobacter sp. TaxID=1967498 RepID=UPI003C5DE786
MSTACHVNLARVTLTDAEIERDVALGKAVHAALLERIAAAGDRLDAAGPSRLPGWNRAQVITHLARNADGHRRMIEGAGRGEVLEQYPGGVDGRNAGIDEGATRSAAAAIGDLVEATAALEAAWEATDWQGAGRRTLRGETPIDRLAFLRVREVALHGVDLDIGIELDDLDPLYVRLELARMEMLWTARQPMGLTPLPAVALALAPPARLGWFTGRLAVDGLRPAAIF